MLCTYIFVLCKRAKVYYAKDYVMDASTAHKPQKFFIYLWLITFMNFILDNATPSLTLCTVKVLDYLLGLYS